MSQYLNVFMDECQEHLQILNQSLLDLEGPENIDILHAIFRSAHTLKGASGHYGLNKMANVTHAMEMYWGGANRSFRSTRRLLTCSLMLDLLEALARNTEGRKTLKWPGSATLEKYSSNRRKR